MPRTTIIIPCFNESNRLDVRRFVEYALDDPSCNFLFVNDGSTDTTLDLLSDLNQFDSEQFGLLNLEKNVGKAEAVRQGVLTALDEGAQFVGYWDADLATPLETIDQFCEYLSNHEDRQIVFGARVCLLGRSIHRTPIRHYMGRIFATVASSLLGISIYDTQCGAKLFRVTPATRQLFAEPFISHWIFDVEILARLIRQQNHHQLNNSENPVSQMIYELPLQEWDDIAGSKVRPRDFLTAFSELIKVYRKYLSPRAKKNQLTQLGCEATLASAEIEADKIVLVIEDETEYATYYDTPVS